jgi:sigma-B regulation protein RsbU (phosphoserine phosphatase)
MPESFPHAGAAVNPPGWALRARGFLIATWRGRILLAVLALWLLEKAGVPLPGLLAGLDHLLIVLYAAWGVYRLVRAGRWRLLWRIRTKLILSYLFIGLVPVVLLVIFFFIAGVLFVSLEASHLVTSELDSLGQALETVARTGTTGLPAGDAAAAATLQERLLPARALHPKIAYALLRNGRTVAAAGNVPRQLPSWWKGPGFAGLVGQAEFVDSLRAIWAQGDSTLILDVPVDAQLFADLERRTGILPVSVGGRVRKNVENKGVSFELEGGDQKPSMRVLSPRPAEDQRFRLTFVATPECADWVTGESAPTSLIFQFNPYDLIRRLSPGVVNMADVLVIALTVVGSVFLVMYVVALLLGLLLARSITRSVHSLSLGTQRLREGDFVHPIQVRSRDQLGELAESFNLMARGVQDLLRQQAEKERLEEELRIARQIQMSLLPPQGAVTLPGLCVAALCLPAAEVGGDYYDLLPLSPTRLGVLVADVSGKGTSAALYMAELKGLVLSLSRIYASPAQLLCEANRILYANMDSRSFVTMTYAVVDTAERTLRHARAGHNPIIQLEGASGRTRILAPAGLGLGLDRGGRFEEILEETEVPLRMGDLFLFYTDGLSEAMNGQAELFGEGRLRQILEGSRALSSDEIRDRILEEIRLFVGDAAPHDDMTMVILKVA